MEKQSFIIKLSIHKMKSITTFFLTILIFGCVDKQKQGAPTAETNGFKVDSLTHLAIQSKTIEIFDSLVAIRRYFHTYPELSGKEQNTAKKVAEYLTAIGLEVKTGVGGYGVIGILKGIKEGKKIAWRADMDAMPSDIPDIVPFSSKNEGVRHICGHDVHTTIALGIATVLASQKESFHGTAYFIFQPAEENLTGAQAMIDEGLFDLIQPDEIFALHMSPFPNGTIATKANELFADYKKVNVTLNKTTNDEALIEFTKGKIAGLQNVPDNEAFWDPNSLGHPEFGIAGPNTIFKDYTIVDQNIKVEETDNEIQISGYISTSDKKQQEMVLPGLKNQFKNSKYADQVVEMTYVSETPTILNVQELVAKTMENIASVYGNDLVIPLSGVISDGRSDDFALFQNKIPGVYFFLGGSDYDANVISLPHAPFFNVDEECIKTGVQFFTSMMLLRLAEQ